MKRIAPIALWLAVAAGAVAQTYYYDLYFDNNGSQFSVYDTVGGEPTLAFDLYEITTPQTAYTNANIVAVYRYKLYADSNVWASCTGSVASVGGTRRATFEISNNWFWAEMWDRDAAVVVTDTNRDRVVSYARGKQTLEAGTEIGGPFSAPTGTPINAALHTWAGWRESGPMYPGSNVAYGAADANGRFAINVDVNYGTNAVSDAELSAALTASGGVWRSEWRADDLAATNALNSLTIARETILTNAVYGIATNAADALALARGVGETNAAVLAADTLAAARGIAETNAAVGTADALAAARGIVETNATVADAAAKYVTLDTGTIFRAGIATNVLTIAAETVARAAADIAGTGAVAVIAAADATGKTNALNVLTIARETGLTNTVYGIATNAADVLAGARAAQAVNKTNVLDGDVSGVWSNLQLGASVVGIAEVNTASLDTRYQVSGSMTNRLNSLWVNSLTDLSANIAGFSGIYTGAPGATVSFTQSVACIPGRQYYMSFTKIGVNGTGALTYAGQTLSATAAGTAATYMSGEGTSNVVLTLYGEALAFCNASNVLVREITNGNAYVARNLSVGRSITLNGTDVVTRIDNAAQTATQALNAIITTQIRGTSVFDRAYADAAVLAGTGALRTVVSAEIDADVTSATGAVRTIVAGDILSATGTVYGLAAAGWAAADTAASNAAAATYVPLAGTTGMVGRIGWTNGASVGLVDGGLGVSSNPAFPLIRVATTADVGDEAGTRAAADTALDGRVTAEELFSDTLDDRTLDIYARLDANDHFMSDGFYHSFEDLDGIDLALSTNYTLDAVNELVTWTTFTTNVIGTREILLHCDGTHGTSNFVDSSSSNWTVTTVGTPLITTNQVRFGQAGDFTGADERLTIADAAALEVGTNSFTLEAWLRPSSYGESDAICQKYASTPCFNWNASTLALGGGGGYGNLDVYRWGNILPLGAWTHFALTRLVINNVSYVRLFTNGVLRVIAADVGGTGTIITNTPVGNVADDANPWSVGDLATTGDYDYNGYLDEFRFVIGTCLYTTNFTPPAAPYDATTTNYSGGPMTLITTNATWTHADFNPGTVRGLLHVQTNGPALTLNTDVKMYVSKYGNTGGWTQVQLSDEGWYDKEETIHKAAGQTNLVGSGTNMAIKIETSNSRGKLHFMSESHRP